MTIAAIILAAGQGKRFAAGPKMLAPFHSVPLVRLAAGAAVGGRARPVVTVLGHEADAVTAALAGLDVLLVRNPAYRDGLSTSLRAGFAALPDEAEAAIVLLGDMPGIGPGLVARLLAAWREARGPPALVPAFRGRRGNPVVLSRSLAPDIARLAGDVGAGPLLRDRPGVVVLDVDDPAVTQDADTTEALAKLAADQASTTPCSTAM